MAKNINNAGFLLMKKSKERHRNDAIKAGAYDGRFAPKIETPKKAYNRSKMKKQIRLMY